MKSQSLDHARKTLNSTLNQTISTTLHSTMDMSTSIKEKVSNKYRTYAAWNYKQSLPKKKKSASIGMLQEQKTNSNNMMNTLMAYVEHLKKKDEEKKKNKKREIKVQELQGIKEERRQRLKKVQNAAHIIQHFISKQGYNPTQEENILLDRIMKLKQFINNIQPFNLQLVLKKCYKIMNISVDLNQLKFLIGTVILTADICFQAKEFVRALHFYTQAVVAATCTNNSGIKVQCFIKIGLICIEINEYEKALIFFKKALQYAWKNKDLQNELKIYDLIGLSYHLMGSNQSALYYHNRSIQGDYQIAGSAIKRISQQMLNQFQKTVNNSEKNNLSNLFIEYLNLPITNFFEVKPPQLKRVYDNYIKGESPRKNREHKNYDFNQFQSIQIQLKNLLQNCLEFNSQIPNPDIQRSYIAMQRFGKPRKNIQFEQSNQYHKLIGVKLDHFDKSVLKLPLDLQVDRAIADKQNPYWWQEIVMKIKKQKQQKVGSLRGRVWNTHKSHHKYPQERKRANSYKQQKISESINRTILNIIDPLKN